MPLALNTATARLSCLFLGSGTSATGSPGRHIAISKGRGGPRPLFGKSTPATARLRWGSGMLHRAYGADDAAEDGNVVGINGVIRDRRIVRKHLHLAAWRRSQPFHSAEATNPHRPNLVLEIEPVVGRVDQHQ